MPKTKNADEEPSFEKSVTALESLVNKMESGELSLEQALEKFEEGIGLIRQCQQTLKNAEQKVQILTEKAGTLNLEPFHHDNDESA